MTVEPYIGRFSRVSSGGMVLPGQCAICGTSDCPEGFVDTKLDVDYFGVIYFCHKCAFELSRVFPEDPFAALRMEKELLVEQVDALKQHITRLEKILDGFTGDWLSSRSVDGVDSGSGSSDDSLIGEAGQASSGSAGDQGELDSGAVKPAPSPKPANPTGVKRLNAGSNI